MSECNNCSGLGYRTECNGERLTCDLCGDKIDRIHEVIEKAIADHCNGGDLWLCARAAAKEIFEESRK